MSSGIDLIVAALGLAEVDAVIKAIRAVDQSTPSIGSDGAAGSACACGTWHCAATYEPRQVIRPDPIYARPLVVHPDPRFEPRRADRHHASAVPAEIIVEKDSLTVPLPPPWKSLPWENPPQMARKVKVATYRPDNNHRGMLLDSFI